MNKLIYILKNGILFSLFITVSQINSNSAIDFVDHVKKSIENAYAGKSKLNEKVLKIHGMSSPKVRHLLNNLCNLPQAKYLEIGTWEGSTFISALYGNQEILSDAIAIDNFSEFGGPKAKFMSNLDTHLIKDLFKFYEADSFNLDKKTIFGSDKINIYFYDGGHKLHEHEQAFTYFDDVLDDVFIAMVDDWNWQEVQDGTRNAFEKLKYQVLFEEILPSNGNGDMENWWNGIYVAVVKKNK